MLSGGIPIGKVFGISIRLHYSWFIIFALVTWALSANYFPLIYPTWSTTTKVVAGVLTSLLFFASVLVHELMHSIVAIREGMKVSSITLFILGGVSQMTEEPKQPQDEFRMAIAGPGSSIVIGVVFGIIYYVAFHSSRSITTEFIVGVSYWLALINVTLGIFNLIPGFPLDGGRVLRSLLWWRSRNLQKATRTSSTIGRGIGYLFILAGVYLVFGGQLWAITGFFNGIWFVLIGWFLESAAVGSYRQMLLQDLLKGHVASEVMSRDCQMVSPDLTIDKLVNEQILPTGRRCFPVVEGGRVEGLIGMNDVKAIPREQWASRRVKDAMTPLQKLKSVKPDEDLNSVLQLLAQNDINQVPVVQGDAVVGVVARDNIVSFINLSNELGKS